MLGTVLAPGIDSGVRRAALAGLVHRGAAIAITDVTGERLTGARLRRHDRLISLGTIAAGLAHELGNDVHAIHVFASLLLRDTPAGGPCRADAQAIRDENQRAVALLERILQFARPERVRFAPEPLEALVRDALAMCAHQLRAAGATVDVRIDSGMCAVCCDARLLSAPPLCKYGSPRSRISLDPQKWQPAGAVAAEAAESGDEDDRQFRVDGVHPFQAPAALVCDGHEITAECLPPEVRGRRSTLYEKLAVLGLRHDPHEHEANAR